MLAPPADACSSDVTGAWLQLTGTSMILELVGMGLLVVSLGLLHRQTQRTAPPRLGY